MKFPYGISDSRQVIDEYDNFANEVLMGGGTGLGVLTLGEGETELGKLTLRVPNLVVRKLYVERLRDLLLPDRRQHDAVFLAAETF
jgi:hypothetical protein